MSEISFALYDNYVLKTSAGIIPFRFTNNQYQVFIGHPGGPFFASKDLGVWSIPKGEVKPGEDMFAAALREFSEEVGIHNLANATEETMIKLSPINTPTKTIYAWAVETDIDPKVCTSNQVHLIWPPKSGKSITFPELDKYLWVSFDLAKIKLNIHQVEVISQLELLVKKH